MASIGGTITHSPNTSGSDICWVLFHSSDINPIHQLFCQLPLSGLRGDCSFGGLWVLVYLGSSSAPHEVWLDFFSPLVFLVLPVSLRVSSIFPEQIWLWLLAFSGPSTGPEAASNINITDGRSVTGAHGSPSTSPASVGLKPAHLTSANAVSTGLAWTWPQPVQLWLLTYRG